MFRSRRKAATPLNVMVVGREGVGKSTFLRTLLASLSLNGKVDPSKATPVPVSTETRIKVHHPVEVECQGHKVALTLIDTPGLPYSAEQGTELATVMGYIESQFETSLIEELKVKRNPKSADTMVHAILYLLPPMLPFHPVDLSAIRTLSNRANVIPLLAHADSITNRQLENLKASLFKTLQENLDLLSFATADIDGDGIIEDEEEEEFTREITKLKQSMPYTVIGAEFPLPGQKATSEFLEVDGQKILGREYKWGVVNVDDEQHCELHLAKFLIFEFALPGLRSFTRNVLYERYRTERLMAHAGKADPSGAKEE
ncbi:Cell division control protein 11 [Blastocladiella emersonii ATCC 22665]|nr:Cell division control protein 11 [Blastocladiella emersonii ATCC 22665]